MPGYQPDARSLLTFHYECLQGMYFTEHIKLSNGSLLFSNKITDPYYNFFAPQQYTSAGDIKDKMPEFRSRARNPAVYFTPLSGPQPTQVGWKAWATDAWMVAETNDHEKSRGPITDLKISEIDVSRRDEYLAVFEQSYSGDDPNDPYGQLDPSYTTALSESFSHDLPSYRKYYVLAELVGVPVGVAALFTAGNLAGVYGVGSLPQHRNTGIGTAIMAHLTNLAYSDGATHIMLQTEAGSRVERWYQSLGYKTEFTAAYYVPEA